MITFLAVIKRRRDLRISNDDARRSCRSNRAAPQNTVPQNAIENRTCLHKLIFGVENGGCICFFVAYFPSTNKRFEMMFKRSWAPANFETNLKVNAFMLKRTENKQAEESY